MEYEKRVEDRLEKIIIEQLSGISSDLKKLWEAQHEMALQIANLSNPATCYQKHEKVKEDIHNYIQNKEDRAHKGWVDATKIVVGSGGMISLWELLKYIFRVKV
jgi:vacuolar-type H+-ATPase subunit I/STV1